MERASSVHGCGGKHRTRSAHHSRSSCSLYTSRGCGSGLLAPPSAAAAAAACSASRFAVLRLAPSPPPSTRSLASAAPGGSLPLAVAGALACASMATSLRDGRRAKAKLLPAFVSPGTPRLRPRGSEGRETIACAT